MYVTGIPDKIPFFLSQGYSLATQLGHSIVDPVPSLFTFKIEDSELAELSGVKPLCDQLRLFRVNFKS